MKVPSRGLVLADDGSDEDAATDPAAEPLLAHTGMGSSSETTRADTCSGSDADAARLVLKKIDRTIIPLLFVTYMLNFMDKVVLSSAAVFGLREDNVSTVFMLYRISGPWPQAHHQDRTAPSRSAVQLGRQLLLLWLPHVDVSHQRPHHAPPHGQVSSSQYAPLGHSGRSHRRLQQLWRPRGSSLPAGRRRSHHQPSLHVPHINLVHA